MKNKMILGLIILLTLCLSISVVAAGENTTDSTNGDIIAASNNSGDFINVESSLSGENVDAYDAVSTKSSVNIESDDDFLATKRANITIDVDERPSVQLTNLSNDVLCAYSDDKNTSDCLTASATTVKATTKTTIKVTDKNINYRQGSKCIFIVRLLDVNGNPLKSQKVTFKVDGKTYTATTDSKGYAKIFLKLKKGTYTVKFSFAKKAPYLGSSGSYKINVKPSMGKGNGYWMWAKGIKTANLKTLAAKGTKHIFLNSYAITLYGTSAVKSFITNAHKYGIKVHIWMQVCYDGGWVSPVNKDGSFKYSFMNKKIAEAKKYAKITGVDGVHLDYMRFGGTAHYYSTSTKAINYMVKKIAIGVRSVKSNCIVSVAIMPEPSMNKYYYGQDVPTMSKYVDALLPMVYKGNYNAGTSWIQSVTKTLVSQSNGAQIWTGLQAYKSDSNVAKLSHSELLKDAKAAKSAGAAGVILFRFGLSNLLNFNNV